MRVWGVGGGLHREGAKRKQQKIQRKEGGRLEEATPPSCRFQSGPFSVSEPWQKGSKGQERAACRPAGPQMPAAGSAFCPGH